MTVDVTPSGGISVTGSQGRVRCIIMSEIASSSPFAPSLWHQPGVQEVCQSIGLSGDYNADRSPRGICDASRSPR